MTCTRCGHPHESHGEGPCRVATLTGWDDVTRAFTGRRKCECAGYAGQVCRVQSKCPHECQTHGKHPTTCVHCGADVRESAK